MQANIREVVILFFVSLISLAANLPNGVIGITLDRNLLLLTLVATVVISLFRHLKLTLFITVSVLAIGANLPEHLANQLGVDQLAMIVASGVLVVIALINKSYQIRSSCDSNDTASASRHLRIDTFDSRNDVISSIRNGNTAVLYQLLISGVEINFSQNDVIPLFLAIEQGNADILALLLSYGAKLRVKNKNDETPIEFALLHADTHIVEMIHCASKLNQAIQVNSQSPGQWRGKVVVLFADICGSTALYDRLGNEPALQIITRTLIILNQIVDSHNGRLIKTIGDEVMCTFPSIDVATKAACAMHYAIDTQKPGGNFPIFVRIGYHYGEVIHKSNDIYGDTVNIAARVTASTGARQIMTTQTVIDAIPDDLNLNCRPVMRTAFRGMKDSFAIFQILWEPENTLCERIGRSSFRKRNERSGDQSSDERMEHEYSRTINSRGIDTINMKNHTSISLIN